MASHWVEGGGVDNTDMASPPTLNSGIIIWYNTSEERMITNCSVGNTKPKKCSNAFTYW